MGEAFDAQTVGWIDDPVVACSRLAEEDLEIVGYITAASNGTLLCRLGDPAGGWYAVYKPEQGERPLWDFPDGTLYRREVAAYAVSSYLGWGLVPPTVVRDGPLGVGSLQLFVPHDPAEHYFTLVEEARWHGELVRLAMFDMVANNADRKGGHILRSCGDDRLFGIDNGLTFHVEPKLRTVVWDVDGVPFDGAWKADLERLCSALGSGGALADELDGLLQRREVGRLARRAEVVAGMASLPRVPPDRRHYPWPPV